MIPLKVPKWVAGILEIPRDYTSLSANFLKELRKDLSKFSSDSPEVSIVMPVYNEEMNLIQTLYSISKMELNCSVELIAVNNNSTDGTQFILEKLGVKNYFQPVQGISHTRQMGLMKAKGKYHLCVDADSIYHKDWLKEYVKTLNDKNVSVVYGKYSFLPLFGESRREFLALYEFLTGVFFKIRRREREYLNVLGFNFGFRTDDGHKVGGFNTTRPKWSDGWMAMNLQSLGKMKQIHGEAGRVWTNARRLNEDGSLYKAFKKRAKQNLNLFTEYFNKFNFG